MQDELSKMQTDKAILIHSMQLLNSAKSDPDIILCSDSMTLNQENLDKIEDHNLIEVFEDFYQFSCSFVKQKQGNHPLQSCVIDSNCL